MSDTAAPWSPTFFELGSGEYAPPDRIKGQHSWYVRGQNFVTVVSKAGNGEVLSEEPAPDEHLVLVLEGTEVGVAVPGNHVSAAGPSIVVVPAGPAQVTMRRPGDLLRVFSTRGSVAAKAANAATYAVPNPTVASLLPLPETEGAGGLRVIPLSDVAQVPGRLGRIYRSGSLMVNWFAPVNGPRDTDELSPHVHDDFEQASVTVEGDFVHHVRRPWTKRMRDWRPDEHVQLTSPSVTVIPPGNIHTRRWVNRGAHQLIDVFAPPRADFIEQGWVLNQSDYEPTTRE
ncbi:hypothetical protein [Acrocarpospora catenulata]|uniref:hypothetical protein n=1 Tax=Acrocarpospora catenulata TaxID=2836182 RepID=UPI001BD9914C|nr:hypothetical protein [Acrocarpospora catenulata]